MSKRDALLVAMAVLSAIFAVAATTEGRWVNAAVWSGLVISFVVFLVHFHRRRRQ